jgi:hypothetical protein
MLQGGAVVANVGDKSGYARVRVLPKLPWTFDFEKAPVDRPPLTWVGAGGKFAVRDLEGNKVLTKLTDIDLYARARTNFGTVDMAGNTLQADVRVGKTMSGTQAAVAGRGDHQQPLRPRAAGQPPAAGDPRLAQRAARVVAQDDPVQVGAGQVVPAEAEGVARRRQGPGRGQGVAGGRGGAEQWNIRVEDTQANPSGAPGLYGNSLVTPIKSEVYYDNITLSPNEATSTGK